LVLVYVVVIGLCSWYKLNVVVMYFCSSFGFM